MFFFISETLEHLLPLGHVVIEFKHVLMSGGVTGWEGATLLSSGIYYMFMIALSYRYVWFAGVVQQSWAARVLRGCFYRSEEVIIGVVQVVLRIQTYAHRERGYYKENSLKCG